MDYEKHRREMLEHCIRLAEVDKHYAWWYAQKVAAESFGVLADLPEKLTEAMLAKRAAQETNQPEGEQ